LSASAALPRFVEYEQQYGSITNGLLNKSPTTSSVAGPRYSLFMSLPEGIGALVDTIANQLPPGVVRAASEVRSIGRTPDRGFQLDVNGDKRITCDKLILATPASIAAGLMEPLDAETSRQLGKIPYSGCVIACLGFARNQFPGPLPGFGFVVPEIENRRILAASFSSSKFSGRAPKDHVLVRVFIGGASQPERMKLPDEDLIQIAIEELSDLLQLSGPPVTSVVARWDKAMPQYVTGHMRQIESIEQGVDNIGNLALVGNAYYGVGIPQCIRTAELAVERLLD
ncbi:MAG: protoporphyrinogen oxidase, partial [Planctomycetales bacterium]